MNSPRAHERFPDRVLALYYAARGWILLVPFVLIVVSRVTVSADERPLQWGMLGVIAAGMLLRLWAGAHAGPHTNGARAGAPVLATSGPYAFSRHPLYLSNLAIGAGLVLLAGSLEETAKIGLLAFLFVHHLVLALHEERELKRLWPEEYGAYAAVTPRWFSLRPPAAAENITQTRDWSGARARQGRNLIYATACVAIVWIASRIH